MTSVHELLGAPTASHEWHTPDAGELENTVRTSLTLDAGTAEGRDDVAHELSGRLDEALVAAVRELEALGFTVRDTLTPDPTPSGGRSVGSKRRKRARRPVETMDFVKLVRRLVRRAGERVGDADEYELAELVGIRTELELAIRTAIDGQRSVGRSWAHIGNALGITRQSAQERYTSKT
jgi:hypothetical protein